MKDLKYSIGKFAQLIGITPDSLRYYEKRNIISPRRDPENGYRYYTPTDCIKMVIFRLLRSCGFSFEATMEKASSINHPSFANNISRRIADIDADIARMNAERRALLDYINIAEKLQADPDYFEITAESLTFCFQSQFINDEPLLDSDRTDIVRILTGLLPLSFYGSTLKTQTILQGLMPEEENTYGIFIEQQYISLFPNLLSDWIPERILHFDAVGHLVCADPFFFYRQQQERLCRLQNQLLREGYTIGENIIYKILPEPINTDSYYAEILLPLTKKN